MPYLCYNCDKWIDTPYMDYSDDFYPMSKCNKCTDKIVENEGIIGMYRFSYRLKYIRDVYF